MPYTINNEDEFRQVMDKIEAYLHKATKAGGFQALSLPEREELQQLSHLAEAWEDQIPMMPIRQPQTLVEMIELKMYERKLNQKKLGISAEFILESF